MPKKSTKGTTICRNCGQEITKFEIHGDEIFIKDGQDVVKVVIACAHCNHEISIEIPENSFVD